MATNEDAGDPGEKVSAASSGDSPSEDVEAPEDLGDRTVAVTETIDNEDRGERTVAARSVSDEASPPSEEPGGDATVAAAVSESEPSRVTLEAIPDAQDDAAHADRGGDATVAVTAEPFEIDSSRTVATRVPELEFGTVAGGVIERTLETDLRDVFPDAAIAEDNRPSNLAVEFPPFDEQIEWRLSPGAVLAGRYKIVRPIAHGAAGEVYEADDLELGEPIAVKTIRSENFEDEGTISRFRREIHLSRKVTHRNVCRIFDIVHDGPLTFVTMELLQGETLAARIGRKGPLARNEAAPIISQLAAGLDAAHAAGVIHRDFKSGNVVLVPARGPAEEPRVVITDFGLARSVESDGSSPTVTGAGDLIGTPAYMAPEQVSGNEVTNRTDVYALGVVVYEMLTGRLPFEGEGSLASAVKRLTTPPLPPRKLRPDIDPAWEAAVLKALSIDPVNRFASAGEMWLAISAPAPARRARFAASGWRWAAIAIAAIVIAGVGSIILRRPRVKPPAPAVQAAPSEAVAAAPVIRPRPEARKSVAVVGFRNLSRKGDTEWLSTAFAEMLTAEVAASEKLRTIPGEAVARMKSDLSLPLTETLARDTLERIRSTLGTDYVVVGGYVTVGEGAGRQLRLDLNIQDTGTGELVATITQVGNEAELLDMVSAAGADLRERLGAGTLSGEQAAGALASLPPGPGIARFYAEGLESLRRFEAQKARDSFELAALADPEYPLVHSALSAAWSLLGYDSRAKEEALLALNHSKDLPRESRLSIEAQYREVNGEWNRAIDVYHTLFEFFPDNEDYGLKLAYAQIQGGRAKDAQATIDALRKASETWNEDPRAILAAAEASYALGEYASLKQSAQAAAKAANQQGDRLVEARARFFEGAADWKLGQPDEAIAAYNAAKKTFEAAGNPGGVARALNAIGVVYDEQGSFEQARKMYADSLAIIRRIGYKRSLAAALNNIANSYEQQGELQQTRKMFEESLDVSREVGDSAGISTISNNLAAVLVKQGDLASAQKLFDESLSISRSMNRRGSEAIVLDNIGMMLFRGGDLAGARSTCSQSLSIARDIGYRRMVHIALQDLATLKIASDDLKGARKDLQESLAIRQELHETQAVVESQLALASIALEEGRPPDAAEIVRQLSEAAGKLKLGRELRAEIALQKARVALATGDVSGAREALTRAESTVGDSENALIQMPIRIARARIAAAEGKSSAALEALTGIAADSGRKGFVDQQLQARLAMCEVLKAAGSAEARGAALALQKDAASKGFALIARRSAALGR